ncbi:sterile alpha motif domain-containing protein 12-like isoform X2 [Brienomyrus brachyistius]|nr:sterile alpha motif domain-containing protein 12-like isoform X2 [Brienomyrus brachyistius]
MTDCGRRVSRWTVEEVCRWVQEHHSSGQTAFLEAIRTHSISGRALLRMTEPQLQRMGIETTQQQEILQDVLVLKVQEELTSLNDFFSEFFPL